MNLFIENSLLDENYLHEYFSKHLEDKTIEYIYIDKSLFDIVQSSTIDERIIKIKAYLELFKKMAVLEIVETRNFKIIEPIEKLLS
jgi:hypothetical protein